MYYCKRDLIFIWILNIHLLQLCARPLSIFAFNEYFTKLIFWLKYWCKWYILNQYWGTLLGKKRSVHNCVYSQQKPNIKSVIIQFHVLSCSSRGLHSVPVCAKFPVWSWATPAVSPVLCSWGSTARHKSSGLPAQPNPPMVTAQRFFPEPTWTRLRLPSTGQGYKYVLLIGLDNST